MSPAPGHISLLSGKAEGFPVLEHILLPPEGAEEVEEAIEERVLPELAEGVRQWRSGDSEQQGSGDTPVFAG